jgi:hypothetical protein
MPIDKRTGKKYRAEEGLGDKTDPMPGMPSPIEQALIDKITAAKAAAAARPMPVQRPMPPAMPAAAPAAPGMKKGGKVSSASKRADGCCVKGKTKGKIV